VNPTTPVQDHYDRVLGEHYSRMFGDFDAKVAEQQALLQRLGIAAAPGALAVDLGCGSGFQSVALARLGFHVLAVDQSARLLAELRERTCGLPIEALAADLRDVATWRRPAWTSRSAWVTTLPPRADGRVRHCSGRREPTPPRRTTGAHVPGRAASCATWIAQSRCASDDSSRRASSKPRPAAVTVHDLIWVRGSDGWSFRKGAYRKLRLAAVDVATRLESAGFAVDGIRHPQAWWRWWACGPATPIRQRGASARRGRMAAAAGIACGGAKVAGSRRPAPAR
jgi:hypothetical protein